MGKVRRQRISTGPKKIDPVIAKALLNMGLNNSQVADKLKVHPCSITRFIAKYSENNDIQKNARIFTDNLHLVMTETMAMSQEATQRGLRYFNELDWDSYCALPNTIKTATMNTANPIFGVNYDKHRLETGQSTMNIDLKAEFQSMKMIQETKQKLLEAENG